MNELAKRIISSFILIPIVIFSLLNNLVLFALLTSLNIQALFEFNNIIKKIFKNKPFLNFVSIFFASMYMTIFSLCVWYFLTQEDEFYKISIIFILLICIFTDLGGFIFGKIIGGKKLSKISPNKTYSGAIGSFIFSLLIGLIFYSLYADFLFLNNGIFILTLIVSFVAQCGDLLISLLKRKAKIKDTGTILPGHGGILDRIDGILIALPLGLIIMLLNK